MRNTRSDLKRDVVAVPQDETRDAVQGEAEPLVIDLTLLPAAPRQVAPVHDMQHWIDLCG